MPKVDLPEGALPEGMSPEQFVQLVTTYQEKRVKSKARSTARKEAVKTLIKHHEPEYNNLLKANLPKGD